VSTDAERLEIRDAKVEGLELRVSRHGTKSWLLRYRRKSDGRKRVLTLGRFPELSLKDARQSALEEKAKIGRGADPAGDLSLINEAMTFAELAAKRLAEDVAIGEGSRRNYRQSFKADVHAAIGNVAACQVTPDMVARILDRIERRGSLVHADRTKAAIGSTYKWAIKRRLGGVNFDPTAGLGKRASATARTRLLSDAELATFWRAIHSDDAPLTPRMRLICQLAVLTGQRRTEVAAAEVAEVDIDGPAPKWIIPGDSKRNGVLMRGRTKNKKQQNVPLSHQAVLRFRQSIELADGNKFVFPAETAHLSSGANPRTPHIHGESVSKALRRLRSQYGIDDITLHDLRRSISTWLGDNGTRPDVIDLILNHQPRDVTRRHYNLSTMQDLVRAALQVWADHVTKRGE
jgi:integrase